MTKMIAVDSNNDIYVKNDGNLAINNDLAAVSQNCENAVKAQLGEMIFAVDRGVPNFQTIWNGSPNLAQFEASLRQTILQVEGVLEITDLTTRVDGGILFYIATIQTIYGSTVLNG